MVIDLTCESIYLDTFIIFSHCMAKSAFMARAWFGGISIGSWASRRRVSLSSFVSAFTSDCICVILSPPLMQALMLVSVRVRRQIVLELALELLTLQL